MIFNIQTRFPNITAFRVKSMALNFGNVFPSPTESFDDSIQLSMKRVGYPKVGDYILSEEIGELIVFTVVTEENFKILYAQ